jgi:Na+-translocating ferredoxin:NAD+ oxidoreductase RNF subunit RnfB
MRPAGSSFCNSCNQCLASSTKTLIEMRDRGQTETEIAAMLDKVEVDNRGKVEDWILHAT